MSEDLRPECVEHIYQVGKEKDQRDGRWYVTITCSECPYRFVVGRLPNRWKRRRRPPRK